MEEKGVAIKKGEEKEKKRRRKEKLRRGLNDGISRRVRLQG